jgi:hypothetical protein
MHLTAEQKGIEIFNRDSVSSAIPTIPRGASYRFAFDRAGDDISGWVCLIELKRFPDDPALISRILQPEGNIWKGVLTPAETGSLDINLYYLTAKLTNATLDEVEEIPSRMRISKAWI